MKTFVKSIAVIAVAAFCLQQAHGQTDPRYKWHDRTRPLPTLIDPGTASTQDHVGRPPSDAIVLFNGTDLSQWTNAKGGPSSWKVEHGYVEVAPGKKDHSGDLQTRQAFGDMQLHVEFAEPLPAIGKDQDRGNSGVILMGQFEIQILDSYHSDTYADGQAGAVYGEYPPQVNASRPPGQWQTYDIIFHGPHFDKDGNVTRKARVTVLHNGILVQDNVEIEGNTTTPQQKYNVTAEKMPFRLQDHGHPVRFRNIWVRELAPGQ